MIFASTHFYIACLSSVPPAFGERDVRVHAIDYRQITGRTPCAERRSRRIVMVVFGRRVTYGILKESHLIPIGTCWLGLRARPYPNVSLGVQIRTAPIWLKWVLLARWSWRFPFTKLLTQP